MSLIYYTNLTYASDNEGSGGGGGGVQKLGIVSSSCKSGSSISRKNCVLHLSA